MGRQVMIALLLAATAFAAAFIAYTLKPTTEQRVSVTVDEIRQVAQLATVEYSLTGFVTHTFSSRVGLGIRKPSDYVWSLCTGKIYGRVDMEKATVQTTGDSDRPQVSIHFGPGSILISDVEVEKADTKSVREDLAGLFPFHAATSDQRNDVAEEARKQMKESALKTGIVEKTKENAERVLQGFVGSFGCRAVVTFDEDAYSPPAAEE